MVTQGDAIVELSSSTDKLAGLPALAAALALHAARRPAAGPVVAQMLDFLERHGSRAFLRENPEGHFCGSAWVVDARDPPAGPPKVLLTHHRKLGRWLQLGGHADGETDLGRVALTEAHEESGLRTLRLLPEIYDVDIHEIPARPGEPAHRHLDVRYVVLADAREPLVTSAESHALAWVAVDSLLHPETEVSMARMARYWGEARR